MSAFIEISIKNALKESETTNVAYNNKEYIIYYDISRENKRVRINTYYFKDKEKLRLCKHYDRGLCDTLEEYKGLKLDYIEEMAYGSWMDGAR